MWKDEVFVRIVKIGYEIDREEYCGLLWNEKFL